MDRGVIPWTQERLASSRQPPTLAMLRPVSAPAPRQVPPAEYQRAAKPAKGMQSHSGVVAVVPGDGEGRRNQAVIAKRLQFAVMETETDEGATMPLAAEAAGADISTVRVGTAEVLEIGEEMQH